MKTSTILIVFLFAFATKTFFFALANNPVLDINGDNVETGVDYYVVSYMIGAGGGGLYQAFDPNKKCPEVVVQHRSDMQNGLPVTFSAVDSSENIVYENAKVMVTFIPQRPKRCKTSTTWQVMYDESAGKELVTLGGVEGKTATEFTIEKYAAHAYKFKHQDKAIGRYSDRHGFVRLAVDNEYPWGWVFIKANRSKTIKQMVNVY